MSVCTFIASDYPLPEAAPSREYPLCINIDSGEVFDRGADDNFFLHHFRDTTVYTDKKYGVWLEWNYTEGRAKKIINYIKDRLQFSDSLELWHVWLMDYCEFEERPFVHRRIVSAEELTVENIKEIDEAEIWNRHDRYYPERPSFYCLTKSRKNPPY